MIAAITLAAVSMVLLCIGFVVFRRRKRREEDELSLQRHFIFSDSKRVGEDDTVNTRLDTSSTSPYTGGQRQKHGGYSTSFLTAAQAHACVDIDADARPNAGEVLYQLQLIMNMYENATL
ncbi:hypothetical protein GQ600_5870 [Phytophthora cactorum]|nr:hypothetical protein GQ600_5870 [Phytophthora cactorum]